MTQQHAPEHFEEGEETAPPGTRLMAVVRWLLVVVMGLVAIGSGLYYLGLQQDVGWTDPTAPKPEAKAEVKTQYQCPMHPKVLQDQPGDCPICNMKLVAVKAAPKPEKAEAKTKYQCPMHPSVLQDQPGDCPICNMKLLAVTSSGDVHAHDAVGGVPGLMPITLSAERIQLSGVRTAQVMRESLTQELRTVGYVTADETSLAQITTRFGGYIEELPASTTGERVTKGQVLATIYSPELLTAQNELINATRWKQDQTTPDASATIGRLSTTIAEDARRRIELLGISADEIDRIIDTGKPITALSLRSPVTGYVTRKNAVRGAYVDAGTTLFEVADLGHVWVLADIYENEMAHMRIGQKAKLNLVPYPDRTFVGRVDFIYPVVDSQSRTMRIRLDFANRDLALRPGMYGDVVIERAAVDAVIIPFEALVDTGKYQYVFLVLDGGRFVPRRVRTGRHARQHVEILEGLADGDRVVTTANFLVDSESRLRATIEGFAAETPAPASQPAHEH
jgi:Cu(I)/Ag(I) efflux system membrane fusion protein